MCLLQQRTVHSDVGLLEMVVDYGWFSSFFNCPRQERKTSRFSGSTVMIWRFPISLVIQVKVGGVQIVTVEAVWCLPAFAFVYVKQQLCQLHLIPAQDPRFAEDFRDFAALRRNSHGMCHFAHHMVLFFSSRTPILTLVSTMESMRKNQHYGKVLQLPRWQLGNSFKKYRAIWTYYSILSIQFLFTFILLNFDWSRLYYEVRPKLRTSRYLCVPELITNEREYVYQNANTSLCLNITRMGPKWTLYMFR